VTSFTDCNADAWYIPYVGSLVNEGLTTGMGDGTYGVGLKMTRQDTATMLSRAMVKYQSIVIPFDALAAEIVSTFSDVDDIAAYAVGPIAFFTDEQIIKGYDVGDGSFEFRPKANITRAEISKIMSLSLNYVTPTPTPTNIAFEKPVTAGADANLTEAQFANDNDIDSNNYASLNDGPQYIQIDLGANYNINDIQLWHYYTDRRTYNDVVVQLSGDSNFEFTSKTIFNNDSDNSLGFGEGTDSEYAESARGKDINFPEKKGRYIRIWSNGSSSNEWNNYVEVKAYGTIINDDPYMVTNVALNKTVTASAPLIDGARILDGHINEMDYSYIDAVGLQNIVVDMGQSYNLYKVKLWHYYGDGSTYKDVIVQISDDPTFSDGSTKNIFNNDNDNSAGFGIGTDPEYAESDQGQEIVFPNTSARYIRMWSNGSSADDMNFYTDVQAYADPVDDVTPPEGTTMIPVLMYHSINDNPLDEYDLKTSKFDNQMNYLKTKGYTTLTFDEYYNIINNNAVAPDKCVLITFDDGIADNYTVAEPILKSYGFHAGFFIITDFVGTEGYMDIDQIKGLISDGFDIGSHSLNHEKLSDYNFKEQLDIITSGKAGLEELIGQPVKYLSIPYGALNADTLAVLSLAGYNSAFSSYGGFSSKYDNPFALRRIYISGLGTLQNFKDLLAG
jgi:peptidoglycan/xylan/chitin deacetylase (PgdA/CDA1 family)